MNRARAPLKWLCAFLVPLALIGLGVRLLLTPLYLGFEYRLPGFPVDEYGFSTAERLQWGSYGINYLLNNESINYLGDLRFSNGGPLFTERELSHMADVKSVVRQILGVWYISLALLGGVGLWARKAEWLPAYRRGLRLGGWLTLSLAAATAVIGAFGASGSGEIFWQFFSAFHGLFFSGGSWLFAYSDTLIRLYPLRFWQDSVLYIGVLAAFGAAALSFGIRDSAKDPQG